MTEKQADEMNHWLQKIHKELSYFTLLCSLWTFCIVGVSILYWFSALPK